MAGRTDWSLLTLLAGSSAADGTAIGALTGLLQAGYDGTNLRFICVTNGAAQFSVGTIASTASLTVWTPASGKRFRLLWLNLSTSVAGGVELVDGTTAFAEVALAAAVGQSILLPSGGYLSIAANNVLKLTNETGATSTMIGTAIGTEE